MRNEARLNIERDMPWRDSNRMGLWLKGIRGEVGGVYDDVERYG